MKALRDEVVALYKVGETYPVTARENAPDWTCFLAAYQDNAAIIFTEEGILVNEETKIPATPLKILLAELNITINIFHILDSTIIIKGKLPLSAEALAALNYKILPVKPYLSMINPDLQEIILRGHHWLQWEMQSKFCGKCGCLLTSIVKTTEKKCGVCKSSFFPRFSPAIVVLVRNENKILLARSPHFLPKMYSAIAGYVDIGETAEMAVKRELKEEVGIQVKNISYMGSQTWPFPDSFMLAFKADYLSGDIVPDENEIEDARWFNINALPELPGGASISRKLIDAVLHEMAA